MRKLRTALRINLVQLSDYTGLSVVDLSRIERGELDPPSTEIIRKISMVISESVLPYLISRSVADKKDD